MTQEFVTLPREIVEQALDALLNEGNFRKLRKPLIEESIKQIKAALEQPQVERELATLLRFNTWSSNEGDSWYDCPTDAQIIEDVFGGETPVVDAEYEVYAGWRCVTATYRITWVSEDGDCEAECVSHPQENSSSASTPRQPQPKHEPLDEEEIQRLWDEVDGWFNFARAIEATHNIK